MAEHAAPERAPELPHRERHTTIDFSKTKKPANTLKSPYVRRSADVSDDVEDMWDNVPV